MRVASLRIVSSTPVTAYILIAVPPSPFPERAGQTEKATNCFKLFWRSVFKVVVFNVAALGRGFIFGLDNFAVWW